MFKVGSGITDAQKALLGKTLADNMQKTPPPWCRCELFAWWACPRLDFPIPWLMLQCSVTGSTQERPHFWQGGPLEVCLVVEFPGLTLLVHAFTGSVTPQRAWLWSYAQTYGFLSLAIMLAPSARAFLAWRI